MSEPRQRWLVYFKSGRVQISKHEVSLYDEYFSEPNQSRGINPIEVIHVIEYSAFSELQEKLKAAEEVLFCSYGYVPHEHFDKENCTKCKIIKALEKIRGEYE